MRPSSPPSALVSNVFVLPRVGGRKLWRDAEHQSGASIGIILYPLAVLLLILAFYQRLEVAAAAWGILAFGDGMASLVGMSIGRHKLSWNPRKSWEGSIAYVVFGTAAATALLIWTPRESISIISGVYTLGFAFAVCFATAVLAAALESLPQGLDDNIGVPLVSGLFLLGLVLTEGHWGGFLDQEGLTLRLLVAAAGQRGARRHGLRGCARWTAPASSAASWWASSSMPSWTGGGTCCSWPSSSSAAPAPSSATRGRPPPSWPRRTRGAGAPGTPSPTPAWPRPARCSWR